MPSGLSGLDDKLGGMHPSDLLILAGRPSMGKTALALTVAANAAAAAAVGPEASDLKHEHYVVAVFSLEMSAEQLATRLLSAEAGISSDELRLGRFERGRLPPHRARAASRSRRPLFIDDTPALSVAALRTRARRLKRQHGLSMIVVDYLQLVRGVGNQAQQNRVHEITEVSQGLKALAKELHVPVLALSQLSRAVEVARGQAADALGLARFRVDRAGRGCRHVRLPRRLLPQERAEPKQRADESVERFQERYNSWFQRFQESRNKADVIIAKQRNGPIGTVHLQFDPSYGRFRNPGARRLWRPAGLRGAAGSRASRGRPGLAISIVTITGLQRAAGSASVRRLMRASSSLTNAARSSADRSGSKALASVGPKAARTKPACPWASAAASPEAANAAHERVGHMVEAQRLDHQAQARVGERRFQLGPAAIVDRDHHAPKLGGAQGAELRPSPAGRS